MRRTANRPIPSGGSARRRRCASASRWRRCRSCQLTLTVNVLAASLALGGFVGYVGVYTIWLKRRTPHNIVIGGAAGAMPPLVGWAATRGSLSWTAVYLFAIVFYWTPPHFWALSLLMKDEYAEVGVPMLPVVRGERETRRQILLYTLLLYAVTQLPFCAGAFGGIYLVSSIVLGLAVHRRRGAALPPGRPPRRRCACTCSRCSTWRCCSAPWSPTSSSEPWPASPNPLGSRRHGQKARPQEHPLRPDRRRRSACSCSGSRSSPPRSTSTRERPRAADAAASARRSTSPARA